MHNMPWSRGLAPNYCLMPAAAGISAGKPQEGCQPRKISAGLAAVERSLCGVSAPGPRARRGGQFWMLLCVHNWDTADPGGLAKTLVRSANTFGKTCARSSC